MNADQAGRDAGGRAGTTAAPQPSRPQSGSTLDFLIGDWNVVRQISDAASGRSGSFLGTASFRPDGAVVRYAERGELTFGDHRGPASRTLTYSGRADGAADVRFSDGREFFRLDLGTGAGRAEHLCGADRYQVTVTRTSEDSFTETWHVTGPAKDYELRTGYARAAGDRQTDGSSGSGDLGSGGLRTGDLGTGDLGTGDLGTGDLGTGDLGTGDLRTQTPGGGRP